MLTELIYACEIFALLFGGVLLILCISMLVEWLFGPPSVKPCTFTKAFEQEVWKKCLHNEAAEKAWRNGDHKTALALLGYPPCSTI